MGQDTNEQAPRAQCPEEVLAWIPWYADGLLTPGERGAVEAHAAGCADCRAELDLVSGAPWACEGIALPDADRIFDGIRARIAREGETREGATVIPISRGRALSEEEMARLERWVLDPSSERDLEVDAPASRTPAPVRSLRRPWGARSPVWAAAAAGTLLVLGGLGVGSLASLSREGGAQEDAIAYTLASAGPAPAGAASAPMIDVVFSDDASARQIGSTLRGLGFEIVSGPTDLGVYRLRLRPMGEQGGAPDAAGAPDAPDAAGAADARDAAVIARQLVEGEARIAIFAEPVR